MSCGAEDALCQALTAVLHDNEFATTVFLKGVWPSWKFLSDHGDKLVGLLGIAFGFYKWWTYREQILHARFENYLLESDTRLFNGRSNVLDGLQRPGPGRPLALPLFADADLCSVLRQKNWGWSFTRLNVLGSAEKQLADAAASIERRLATAEAGLSSLRHQLATTHVLRGSIASAFAVTKSTSSDDQNATALDFFRSALQVPGQDLDPIAKELEAHQLRRLGDLRPALTAYRALEGLAGSINGHRAQRLLLARAKRRQAEILQSLASFLDEAGQRQLAARLLPISCYARRKVRTFLQFGRLSDPSMVGNYWSRAMYII
jgi:hypothetical protein